MTVRVVFCRKHHVGSLLLRAFLWSGWSHCAIIDGDEVIEAVAPDGVRARPLADLLAESSRFEVLDFPARDPAAVIAAARAQIGARSRATMPACSPGHHHPPTGGAA